MPCRECFSASCPTSTNPEFGRLHWTKLLYRCKIHDDGQTSQEIPEDAGALIQLQNGEADIALIPLLVTESRSANFSYILSHVNKTYSIVIHKYFLTNSQSLNTEDHISPIIWFMIFLAITTLCSIIVLSHRLHLRNSTGVLSSLFATLMQAVWCEFGGYQWWSAL